MKVLSAQENADNWHKRNPRLGTSECEKCMHKQEAVQENETKNSDFEMQTNHSTPTRTHDFILINKKKRACHRADFAGSKDYKRKIKENEMNK